MPNMVDCLRRNMQDFVENKLSDVISWGHVRFIVPADGDQEVAVIQFDVGPKFYEIRVQSPFYDEHENLGSIALNGIKVGPVDEATWATVANMIRKGTRERQYG